MGEKKGIWIKDPACQDEESYKIDPDLFPLLVKEPEAWQRTSWTQTNGIWTRSPEQDPDIPTDLPGQDPEISTDSPELTQKRVSTENLMANEILITPPLKRLRKKQLPVPCILRRTTTSQLPMPLHSSHQQARQPLPHNNMLW